MSAFQLTLLNTQVTPPDALIYTGIEATLTLSINNPGAPLTLTSDPNAPSWLKVDMPSFLLETMSDMGLSATTDPSNWKCELPIGANYFKFTYIGSSNKSWGTDEIISFQFTKVCTDELPQASDGTLTVTPKDITGMSKYAQTSLKLLPPAPFELAQMLAISLLGSEVYITPDADGKNQLENTLKLNFLNIRPDGKAFFTGSQMENPMVKVWFDYGDAGNQICSEKQAKENIKAKQLNPSSGGSSWKTQDATDSTHGTEIYWSLLPQNTNVLLANESVTIEFSHIIPNGALGVTNIYVGVIGFPKDYASSANDTYNQTYTKGISKTTLPQPGILSFDLIQSLPASFSWFDDPPKTNLELHWIASGVSKIAFTSALAKDDLYDASYGGSGQDPVTPLQYGAVSLEGIDLSNVLKQDLVGTVGVNASAYTNNLIFQNKITCELSLPPGEISLAMAINDINEDYNPTILVNIARFGQQGSGYPHFKVNGAQLSAFNEFGELDEKGIWVIQSDYAALSSQTLNPPQLQWENPYTFELISFSANLGTQSTRQDMGPFLVAPSGSNIELHAAAYAYEGIIIEGSCKLTKNAVLSCNWLNLKANGIFRLSGGEADFGPITMDKNSQLIIQADMEVNAPSVNADNNTGVSILMEGMDGNNGWSGNMGMSGMNGSPGSSGGWGSTGGKGGIGPDVVFTFQEITGKYTIGNAGGNGGQGGQGGYGGMGGYQSGSGGTGGNGGTGGQGGDGGNVTMNYESGVPQFLFIVHKGTGGKGGVGGMGGKGGDAKAKAGNGGSGGNSGNGGDGGNGGSILVKTDSLPVMLFPNGKIGGLAGEGGTSGSGGQAGAGSPNGAQGSQGGNGVKGKNGAFIEIDGVPK